MSILRQAHSLQAIQHDRLAEPLKAFSTHWRGSSLLFLYTALTIFVMLYGINVLAQNNQLNDLMRQIPQQAIAKEKTNPSMVKIARLHYSGGGDWYLGRSAISNMLSFAKENLSMLKLDLLDNSAIPYEENSEYVEISYRSPTLDKKIKLKGMELDRNEKRILIREKDGNLFSINVNLIE